MKICARSAVLLVVLIAAANGQSQIPRPDIPVPPLSKPPAKEVVEEQVPQLPPPPQAPVAPADIPAPAAPAAPSHAPVILVPLARPAIPIAPAGPTMSREQLLAAFATVKPGLSRERLIQKLGVPAYKISFDDGGKVFERLRFRAEGKNLVLVELNDGLVQTARLLER